MLLVCFTPTPVTIQTLADCLVAENWYGSSLPNECHTRNTLNQVKHCHAHAIRGKNSRDEYSTQLCLALY